MPLHEERDAFRVLHACSGAGQVILDQPKGVMSTLQGTRKVSKIPPSPPQKKKCEGMFSSKQFVEGNAVSSVWACSVAKFCCNCKSYLRSCGLAL